MYEVCQCNKDQFDWHWHHDGICLKFCDSVKDRSILFHHHKDPVVAKFGHDYNNTSYGKKDHCNRWLFNRLLIKINVVDYIEGWVVLKINFAKVKAKEAMLKWMIKFFADFGSWLSLCNTFCLILIIGWLCFLIDGISRYSVLVYNGMLYAIF